ncbi:hypothetical protein KIPB_013718, partial [Kipferlia bialata]
SSWAVNALDFFGTQVCLPLMQEYYDVPESSIQWIQIIYSLTISAISVVAGKLGDRLGGD